MMFLQKLSNFIERPRFLYAALFIWMTVTGGCFLSPFLEHLGLDESEIGIALSCARLVEMICNGFAGAWADHRERLYPRRGRAQVMAVGVVGASVATLCHVFCTRSWQHILLRPVYSAFASMIPMVLDGMTMEYLGEKLRADYGKERLHGAIWWALAHWILSVLVQNMGFRAVYLMTIITGPGMLSCLLVFSIHQRLPHPELMKRSSDIETCNDFPENDGTRQIDQITSYQAEERHPDREMTVTVNKSELPLTSLVGLLLSSFHSVAFFTAAFCLATGQSVADNFSFLFFETLGSSFTIMGWTIVLTIGFEVPIFQIAPALLQRFGSSNMLLLASVCYVVRVTGYSLIPSGYGWIVLLFEPLHGVTYACAQTAIVDFVAQLMPPGYHASGQGLAQSFRGLGGILGVGVGGFVAQIDGNRMVYRVAAVIVAVGSAFFLLGSCKFGSNEKAMKFEAVYSMALQEESDEEQDIQFTEKGSHERQALNFRTVAP